MAKKVKPTETNQGTNGQTGPTPPAGAAGGETTAGYFRRIFQENPKLLTERSNKVILQRWLDDHPGVKVVPKAVKANLANLKSVLRSNKRNRVAARAQKKLSGGPDQRKVARVPTGDTDLERLEHQIDECLISAKLLDRDALQNVISHLRWARNEVVWKLGK
jgi:hypothetical protein